MGKFSRRWVAHSFSDAQKVAGAEAAKVLLRILQEKETNDCDGIATGDGSRCQYTMPPSKMSAHSAADIILTTRQAIDAKETMTTVFFTAEKCVAFDVLPSGGTFNQQ
jgi:hypothetical protein